MSDTHIKINAVTPRVQYTGNGVTTTFPYEFAIFDETDMVVYVGDDIIESGYTVTGAGETEGGTVVFDTAPDDGAKITLLRNVPIERVTDFQEGGTFRPKNLNDEFDRQTAFVQQVQEILDRAVKVGPTSDVEPEKVLTQVERVYQSIDNVDVVADDISNVNAVASNISKVQTTANNISNVNTVAGNISNVNTVASISSNVTAVAGNATNINSVAGNSSNINAVAGNSTNINAVNSNKTNIDAVASNATNINAVAGNATNINAVNANKTNINSVAGNSSNINTVATNISDVNTCATNMAAIQDAPNQAQAAADSAALAYQYGNDKINQTHISNCITKIPQDIKLELNNGILTLKAGSKVYDGNGLFAEVQTDTSLPNAGYNGQVAVIYTSTDVLATALMGDSVASLPSPSSSYKVYYNTTDKKCYLDTGSWIEVSFPIALATSTVIEFTSIDKVFNGSGEIGSTVFALPGVEGLIPNERNEDKTLKSTEFTTDRVLTFTYTSDNPRNIYFLINGTQCTIDQSYYYDEDKNLNISLTDNTIYNMSPIAVYNNRGGKVNNFISKTVFHVLDYNDTEYIASQSFPSDNYVDLTLGASGATYTAPADGYIQFTWDCGEGTSFIAVGQSPNSDQVVYPTNYLNVIKVFQIRKGNFVVYYSNVTVSTFRFVYARGNV